MLDMEILPPEVETAEGETETPPPESEPTQPGTELIPRATIEEIVGHRNAALEMYATAWDALDFANAKVQEATGRAKRAYLGQVNCFTVDHHANEVQSFYNAIQLPARDQYLRTARKLVDGNAWAAIVAFTELERLMDSKAKQELYDQMRYVPDKVDPGSRQLINGDEIAKGLPDFTVDNVYATLERFRADSPMIFRRGIANAFSKLDRRFKSHDGFKIGSRIILTHVFTEYGSWSGYGAGCTKDVLIDIERVFAILDGKFNAATFSAAVGAIDRERIAWSMRSQSCIETDYFRIRTFQNGNIHLWMLRKDLVAKVNQLLAEWYGEVIADGMTKEADPFANPNTLPAKRYGYYPTPSKLAEEVVGKAYLHIREGDQPLRILEPEAGGGALARECAKPRWHKYEYEWCPERKERIEIPVGGSYRHLVDCVELQPHLAEELQEEGIYNRVYLGDFLQLRPEVTGLYDRVVMNPPFDMERDIDHVMHALKFLEPDGFLTAIMSAGTEFRETRKAVAFRKLMEAMKADWHDLPAGSFSEMGTNVNTCVLRMWKNGTQVNRWNW
jgi:hypothetical protein